MCKKFFTGGTKSLPLRIVNQRVQKPSKVAEDEKTMFENERSVRNRRPVMDAKWNEVIDRFSTRSVLLAVVFAVWLAISYGVLAA